jgi:hypothetical protein
MPRAFGGGACAFLVADGEPCGAPRKLASSYCPPHHALTHLAIGSRAEQRRLRLIEVIGEKVSGTIASRPLSTIFLRRLQGLRP